jgi:hypothetical protein
MVYFGLGGHSKHVNDMLLFRWYIIQISEKTNPSDTLLSWMYRFLSSQKNVEWR